MDLQHRLFWTSMLAVTAAAHLSAASKLQLAQTTPAVVSVAQGSNGTLNIDAKNAGDGALTLTATGSAPWLVPTIGASHACSDGSGPACLPIQIALQTSALAKGNYTGLVTVSDPNATDSPQYIVVSVQVGTGVPDKLDFTLPVGGSASTHFSTASGANVTSATSDPKATWLATTQDGGSPFSPNTPYKVSVGAGGLAAGDYSGSVTVSGSTTAAENKTIPVTLHVVAQAMTGPLTSIGGALNNATYASGESLAQGDIIALFGSQYVSGAAAGVVSLPLSTTLGGVQVFLNDQAVPLYYVSAGQINFQVPFNATVGEGRLRVESNGTRGNTISVTIARAVPRILRLNGNFGDYGIITNPDNSLTIPAALGGHAAKVGGALVIYAIGFGPTTPAVDSGAGSPAAEPLARLTDHPKVCFSAPTPFSPGLCVDPIFAGLAPGFVGLYQINVVVPQGAPIGDIVPIFITTDDGNTNIVNVAISQ